MIHILVLAHAPLASALADAARHAFGDADGVLDALDVPPTECPDVTEVRARAIVARWATEAAPATPQVLLLTDVFGATPCNVAQRLADGAQVRCLAGVNVPMLWRALNYRAEPLDQVATKALAGGAQGVMPVGQSRPPQNQVTLPSHAQDDHHHQQ